MYDKRLGNTTSFKGLGDDKTIFFILYGEDMVMIVIINVLVD